MTDRQKKTLSFIKEFITTNGFSPTIREIAKAIDTSPSVALHTVNELEDAGYISTQEHTPRTISVTGMRIILPKDV